MRIPINNIINFVLMQTKKYNIDESHSLNHALSVLNYSKYIYNEEVIKYPFLQNQRHIIYTSALIHDTCDSKYTNDANSINNIKTFLSNNEYTKNDQNAIIKIITEMSYHKIKKNGFPKLTDNENAFHIVREADLLAGYEFNRAVLYGIYKLSVNYTESFSRSKELYFNRMDKQLKDNLFTTEYGKKRAKELNEMEKNNINIIDDFIKNDTY